MSTKPTGKQPEWLYGHCIFGIYGIVSSFDENLFFFSIRKLIEFSVYANHKCINMVLIVTRMKNDKLFL